VVGGPCVAVIGWTINDRARMGAGMPGYSVYSDGPDGLAQAADLLRRLGWRAVAVTRPIQQTRHRGLLILAEPIDSSKGLGFKRQLSAVEVDGVLGWVGQGNTLLFCCSNNNVLLEKLGVVIGETRERGDVIFAASPGAAGEYTAQIDRMGLEIPATVSGRKTVPLWWLNGKPAAVAVQHGAGRVLVLPDPSLLTHRGLLREDNAIFLYNVAALDSENGHVYFDEYHHGFRSGTGYWSYLYYHGQQWIIFQLLAVAGIGLWGVGRRLGPAVPRPVTKRADGVDYASSVARIYEKADVRPLIGVILARHFLTILTTHLRLRRSATSHEILAVCRQRHGDASASELSRLLSAADHLRQGGAPDADELLALARRIDEWNGTSEKRRAEQRKLPG
jgi:hypothetical protein